ncbi:phosphotransferase family protein [Dactylosporangium sp. CA-092794]|uniref:phosphotransferase family protein n=1 Tax=Dactylosporangium sp. CA-092794 TaxID=3239929 RepID=UPI003D8A9660
MEPDFGLDPEPVARWIGSLGIGAGGGLTFERIGAGQSNITLDVRDAGGGRWILRRPPLGALLASAHDVAREAAIMRGLAGTAVPVPKIHAVSAAEQVASVPLVLMERVDGLVVDELEVAEGMPADLRRRLSESMIGTLAAIHAVDLHRAGLAELASHKPYAPRQLKRWSTQWSQSKTRDLPALEELTGKLTREVPPQRETVLVHGDFHLRNVISSPETGAVRAVLDWELATLGDPIADLGSMLAYWPQAGDAATGLFAASALPGFATRAELTDAYLSITGRDGDSVGYWHALGLWKIAIICEGVLRRAVDDPRNAAPVGGPTPEVVERLIDRAFAELAGA